MLKRERDCYSGSNNRVKNELLRAPQTFRANVREAHLAGHTRYPIFATGARALREN